MKIGIQSWGSNGDIRPMLALASGLRQAGHTVELAVTSLDNRSYADECQLLGIGYSQVPERLDLDLEGFMRKTLRMNGLQWLKALLDGGYFPYEAAIFEVSQGLVARNDLVIGHHFLIPLKLAARLADKPHVSVTLCHGAIPSADTPPFRCIDLGAVLNPWQWKLFNFVFDAYFRKDLTRLWRTHGQSIGGPLFDTLLTSDSLDLVAVDPVFCPQSLGWSPVHRACGFFNLEDDTRAWEMPGYIADFVAEGAPPVYCTFGSLQQTMPERAMDMFVEAVRLAGCRGIVQTSSARYPVGTRSGGCLFVGRHPHQPVFERCAAIVHHGGAGTTHAATRAGCPSVVMPFMDEQLFWGLQLRRLGLAGDPLHLKQATAPKLAKGIRGLLDHGEYKERAARTGVQVAATDGVGRAVAAITDRLM